MRYFVYIMSSRSRVLYVGLTNDLERRVLEHQSMQVPGFTQKYRVTRLVWFEEFQDIRTAIEREKQIKAWRRSKKIDMIQSFNPIFTNLFQTRDPSLRSG